MSQKQTRRDFIQQSTALGVAYWVSGAPKAFSKEKSPLERVRYACIGVGTGIRIAGSRFSRLFDRRFCLAVARRRG